MLLFTFWTCLSIKVCHCSDSGELSINSNPNVFANCLKLETIKCFPISLITFAGIPFFSKNSAFHGLNWGIDTSVCNLKDKSSFWVCICHKNEPITSKMVQIRPSSVQRLLWYLNWDHWTFGPCIFIFSTSTTISYYVLDFLYIPAGLQIRAGHCSLIALD